MITSRKALIGRNPIYRIVTFVVLFVLITSLPLSWVVQAVIAVTLLVALYTPLYVHRIKGVAAAIRTRREADTSRDTTKRPPPPER